MMMSRNDKGAVLERHWYRFRLIEFLDFHGYNGA
jgi:hypothetical protein